MGIAVEYGWLFSKHILKWLCSADPLLDTLWQFNIAMEKLENALTLPIYKWFTYQTWWLSTAMSNYQCVWYVIFHESGYDLAASSPFQTTPSVFAQHISPLVLKCVLPCEVCWTIPIHGENDDEPKWDPGEIAPMIIPLHPNCRYDINAIIVVFIMLCYPIDIPQSLV